MPQAYEHNLRAVFDMQRVMSHVDVGAAVPTSTMAVVPTDAPSSVPLSPTPFHASPLRGAAVTPPAHMSGLRKTPRHPAAGADAAVAARLTAALFPATDDPFDADLEVAMFAGTPSAGGKGDIGDLSGGAGRYSPLSNPSPFSVLAGSVDSSGIAPDDLGYVVAA